MLAIGSAYGYNPNAIKTCLVVKPAFLADAEELFSGSQV